jgi:hypothetical protein
MGLTNETAAEVEALLMPPLIVNTCPVVPSV